MIISFHHEVSGPHRLPNKCTIRSWSLSWSCQIRAILFKNIQLPYRLSLEGKPQTIQWIYLNTKDWWETSSQNIQFCAIRILAFTLISVLFPSLFIFCCLCQDSCQNIYLQFFLFSHSPQPPTAPTVQLYAFLSVFSAVTNDRFFSFSLHIAFSCLFPFLFFACRKYIIFAAEAKTSIRIKEPPLTLRILETQNSQCMWQIGRDSIPPLSTSHDEI